MAYNITEIVNKELKPVWKGEPDWNGEIITFDNVNYYWKHEVIDLLKEAKYAKKKEK